MANIPEPAKDDAADEPLIPMPSVAPAPTPPAATKDAAPAATDDEPIIPTPAISTHKQAPDATDTPKPPAEPPVPTPKAKAEPKPTTPPPAKSAGNSDLESIKQKALTELKPLLDEVDLPADQKFHTILEIISATNDTSLIPKLYEAAEKIEDKHERAQALVDVVSEIEYLSNDAKK